MSHAIQSKGGTHTTNARKKRQTKPVTINDLFTRDDINDILEELNKRKPDIAHCLILYISKDEKFNWTSTNDTPVSLALWMLEATKITLMKDVEEV